MGGWRRSADRTRLRKNSLQTGNFTGNFAILKPRDTIWYQETAALQPLPEQFPTQINRENILRIRELSSGNREFQCDFDWTRKNFIFAVLLYVARTAP